MNLSMIKHWLLSLCVLFLVGCGGGGNGGVPLVGGGSGSTATDVADLQVKFSATSVDNSGSENMTATITAINANGQGVKDVPLTIKVDNNATFSIASTGGAVTGADGTVTAKVTIGNDYSIRTITMTVSTGKLPARSASFQVTGANSSGSAAVTVALSSTTISPANAATVTVTVRDAKGLPIAGKVVDLKTLRGTLAALSVASVATGSDGSATARLSALTNGVSGADEVVAIATLGTTTVQGSSGFTVTGSAPAVSLTISATTLRSSTGAATVRAELRDAAGNVAPGVIVNFSAAAGTGLVNLSASSAVTDGFGVATVKATAASAGTSAAETLVAAATVGGVSVRSTLFVQLVADSPSMTISPTNSTVTAAAPATIAALVKDTSGVTVPAGTVVSWLSAFGLTAFDATTSVTDSTGVAHVILTPKTPTSNGADQIMVSATVGGVTIIAQVVVQVSSSNVSAPPVLQTSLSSTSISSASPATVTATLTDGKGQMVAGEVVTFTVVRGLAKTNIGTALTDPTGKAVVILSPVASTVAGADEVSASVTYAGTTLQSTKGFQIQATNVTLSSFTSAVASISAYGQTTLSLGISGASVGSPVSISVTSSCVSQGKATLSPTTFTATTSPVLLQYKDNGCGALQATDQLQASIVGGSGSVQLTPPLAISRPDAASLAFISASPEVIYIKGSGFTETSTLTFEVRDFAGNTLPNLGVNMTLLTLSGGVTIESGPWNSNAAGRVTVRVNAGTVPTPIRVAASLLSAPAIATVSSNLSVAVGLPSQLNFSLSQQYFNVEGFDIDGSGIPNTITTCGNSVACNFYNIVASDRNGNPVPDGTSINFVTEGGQIQPIVRTSGSPVTAGASALFRASSPRPDDGRITVTAYALGEESFIDQNGNNTYDPGEPFQDLGNLFKDRLFDGVFDVSVDEYIPTNIANGSACVTPPFSGPAFNGTIGVTPVTSALLALDPGIPSVGGSTCDGVWSGAGKVYVRRATETVLSTSAARALWSNTAGLDALCAKVRLQNGPQTANTGIYTQVAGSGTWYANDSTSTTLSFIVGDANIFPALSGAGAVGRLNPMAAGTTVAATATLGLGVAFVGGSPVPSTREASTASVGVSFVTATSGTVFVTFRSPGGTGTTYAIPVTTAARPSACP